MNNDEQLDEIVENIQEEITINEEKEEEKNESQESKIEEINQNVVIIDSIKELSKNIENIGFMLKEKIVSNTFEEKIMDNMHKELQRYKEDLYSQLVRPILLDVIEVRESIIRVSDIYIKKGELIPNKIFSDYSFDLQDILEKNNIELYSSIQGDEFNPSKHRAVKKCITNDESLHGKIEQSLSNGYLYNNKVISIEKVVVYIFEKSEIKD